MTPWRDFLYFAASINLLSEAEITIEGGGRSVGPATRTSIVTPHEFDYVWRVLHDSEANPISMQWGVALTLGYYGGLRASEVLGLTLQDIYCACGELWVLIRDGKTQAARRDIPLHWLAPPECVDQVERWRQRRRSSVGALRPQSVGLFGPEREPNPYDRHALITPLLDWLRPILGAGVDFHLLRHSTVSWLLLRLHAARHPGFRDRLHHRASWMFGDEALGSVLQLVSDPELAASGSEGNDLRYLAKLIGHRDVGTLLMHYSHTLGPIHDDHLAKAWGGRPTKPKAP
jgi:integrase